MDIWDATFKEKAAGGAWMSAACMSGRVAYCSSTVPTVFRDRPVTLLRKVKRVLKNKHMLKKASIAARFVFCESVDDDINIALQ
jgi:type VI protein secretion system component VasF